MPIKKQPHVADLSLSMDADARNLNRSFSLSDTGSFSADLFTVGRNGITQSPLHAQGEISSLRLDQLSDWACIGRGATSRVYRAVHSPTGKAIAVKVLQAELEASRESRRMILNEIKIVFNAQSNHLISFYDAFFHDGSIYLALEYMDCGSLEGLLHAAKSTPAQLVPEGVSASVLFQILRGLTYLHHEQKAVHRDLKPANVLLDSAGCVKLSDFGIAKQLGSGMYAQAGTQVGTVAYMSPERLRGDPYGFASDVWSVGLIALETALGTYPFPLCRSYFELVKTIVEGPVPSEYPDVQERVPLDELQLVHACLQKAPNERPDVRDLTRFPFFARHSAAPTDLQTYLRSIAPLLAAQQRPRTASGHGGGLGGDGGSGKGSGAASGPTASSGLSAAPDHIAQQSSAAAGGSYAHSHIDDMQAEEVMEEEGLDEIWDTNGSHGSVQSELGP
jgi:mitogen-activated protein kinase kinase 1